MHDLDIGMSVRVSKCPHGIEKFFLVNKMHTHAFKMHVWGPKMHAHA